MRIQELFMIFRAFGTIIRIRSRAYILNAPVSKKAIIFVPGFVGHTGFYEALLGDGKGAIMSFGGDRFHLALFTHHVPLARVSEIVMKADLETWFQRVGI